MVAIELASPGRPRISRKTIAQGRPGVLRWTCMLVCAFCCARCTRDRGCSAHPVFPAPSAFQEGGTDTNLGHVVPRECEAASAISAVVLTKVRTHTPRPISEKMLRDAFSNNRRSGLWVLAYARTT